MRALLLCLTSLCLLLLAAHSLRWGDMGRMTILLLCLGLLFSRQGWARWVLLAVLAWGVWLWIDVGLNLTQIRMIMGQPWLRLVLILGTVSGVTLLAAALMLHRAVGLWFSRGRRPGIAASLAFGLTFLLLAVAESRTSMPLLLLERFAPGWGMAQAWLHGLYAALLCGAMLDPVLHGRLRPRIWGLFSLVFFGQLALGLAGVENLLMTGALHLPVPALIIGGPLYRGGGLFMLILFTVSVLLAGAAWCSHLCYIGAWDDGCSRLLGRCPEQPARKPWRARAVTLALTIALALGLRLAGAPTSVALGLAVAFGLLGVGVMLLLSRRQGRMVHCTHWCPMGLVANLLGRLAPWRMRLPHDCTGCGACGRACRYGALRPEDIASGRPGISCTLCGDCVSTCPKKGLVYSLPGASPEVARAAFIVLIAALHATFLAVARI
jgi:ferredoxin